MQDNAAACAPHAADQEVMARLAGAMPDDATLVGLGDVFQILANPTRLKIVHALAQQELCVCDLAAVLHMSDSAVSHQLRLLRTMRLVRHRRAGRQVFYALDDDHVHQLFVAGLEHLQERVSA